MAEVYHTKVGDKPATFRQLSGQSKTLNQIPEELKALDQWMGTRFEIRVDEKLDKPPYRLRRPIKKAAKTDPENWATFEEALAALERGEVDGIGLVLTEDDPYYVIDEDGVIDLETGEVNAAAWQVVHTLSTYTEISCSGTGLHIIGEGAKPEGVKCKSGALGFDLEVYDRSRFVVLTGNRVGPKKAVMERQEELEELCRKLWTSKGRPRFSRQPKDTTPVNLGDLELLERARKARTGAKFIRLYDHGDVSGYKSASEADFKLLNMLIFWCAGEGARIVDLFKASALYRKKKGRDYVERSTENALATYVGAFYSPRSAKKSREEEASDPLTPYLKLLLDPSQWTGRKGASAYKTYTALVSLASEHGIFDGEGNLRIGCDTRRLAEAAGTRQATVCESGLPTLSRMKLLRWKRGKGANASVFLLPNPGLCENRINKVTTHFIDTVSATPKNALETLQLLIRMRSGYDKSAEVLRLGMPAMFTTVALASTRHLLRGQSAAELAELTGRRKSDLEGDRGVLKRLKAAGVVRENEGGLYRLTDDFAANYERVLRYSGITYTERAQKRQHEEDRRRRDAKLKTDRQTSGLGGKDRVGRTLAKQEKMRRQVASSDLASKAHEVSQEERIERLIRDGMSPRWARREVLSRDHLLDCVCEVCG